MAPTLKVAPLQEQDRFVFSKDEHIFGRYLAKLLANMLDVSYDERGTVKFVTFKRPPLENSMRSVITLDTRHPVAFNTAVVIESLDPRLAPTQVVVSTTRPDAEGVLLEEVVLQLSFTHTLAPSYDQLENIYRALIRA